MKSTYRFLRKFLLVLIIILAIPAVITALPALGLYLFFDRYFHFAGYDPWEAQRKQEEEEIRAAAETQNRIYYLYPQMKDFSQADDFLDTIENSCFLTPVREEAYARINGITPAGQPERYPIPLSALQTDRYLRLIIREKDTGIHFRKEHLYPLKEQSELTAVFHNAAHPVIRGLALWKLAEEECLLRRLVFFIKADYGFKGLDAPDLDDEQRSRLLNETVSCDGAGTTYVLPDRTAHPELWEFMELSGLSQLQTRKWKAFTRKEARECLILSQNNVIEYVKESNTLEGCSWDYAEEHIKELIRWMDDPEFLLTLINDPAVSDFNASELIHLLFRDFSEETDSIEKIREQAINSYFDMNRAPDWLEFTVPETQHEKYGIRKVKEDHVSFSRFGNPINSHFRVYRITKGE